MSVDLCNELVYEQQITEECFDTCSMLSFLGRKYFKSKQLATKSQQYIFCAKSQ